MIDPEIFNIAKLVTELLGTDWTTPGNAWRMDCEIIPKYLPKQHRADDHPLCVVRHKSGAFLRHSKGPKQGHGWDIYGDDYQTPELALIALSNAPPPPMVAVHGRG